MIYILSLIDKSLNRFGSLEYFIQIDYIYTNYKI